MSSPFFKIWSGERLETFVYNDITAEHLHRYAITLSLTEGKKVLDIACGEGYGTNLIAEKAAQVTGVDIDIQTIQKARTKYQKPSLHFVQGEATKIPCENAIAEVVICFETIEHLEQQQEAVNEMARVLTPGGLLIISTPNKQLREITEMEPNEFHKKELSLSEFKLLLQSKFQLVKIFNQYPGYHSYITSDEDALHETYTGSFDKLYKETNNLPAYFIAFCSNTKLPAIPNSIFNPSVLFEQSITQNRTYQVGNILTASFRKIRNLFNKS